METKEVVLPWLVDQFNELVHTRVVPADAEVTLDVDRKFYRSVSDGQEVETFDGKTLTRVKYREENPRIGVEWFGDVVNRRNKSLFIEDGGIYSQQIQGEEQTYISRFVEAVTNPEINPLGFNLEDGVYGSPHVKFDVCFGLTGKPTHLIPLWPEGWNHDPPSLPWEMRIHVYEDIQSVHPKNEYTDVVKEGVYETSLKIWERDPTRVSTMKLDGESEYYMDEETFLDYVVAGKIYIWSILADKWRWY